MEFVNLNKLLKKDDETVKNIKSLSVKEADYSEFLQAVEYNAAEHFFEDRKLKDKDILGIIQNIKRNYTKDLDFFKTELEKDVIMDLSCALQKKRISHHELKLVLNYVLWCIDNRRWMADDQAYLKWITYFFKLYDEEEMKKYEESIRKLSKRLGIPKAHTDSMLMKTEKSPLTEEENEASRLESEFFSLDDDEKFDYVIEYGLDNPYIIEAYSRELEENEDYETAEKLYKKFLDIVPNLPPAQFSLGLIYKKKGNLYLAKHYLENGLKSLDNMPDEFIPKEDKEQLKKAIKKELEALKEK